MPGSNNFLQFDQTATNVVSDAAYAGSSQITSGFTAGVAPSAIMNKALMQVTTMAAALGGGISDFGLTAADTNLSALQTAIKAAYSTVAAVSDQSGNFTATTADRGKAFRCTNTLTMALNPVATLETSWFAWVVNDGTGVVTIDPNGSETIDGLPYVKLGPKSSCMLIAYPTGIMTIGRKPEHVILRDVKASGTNGGDFTSGAERTRVLNTKTVDSAGVCSLASNQFTLDPGNYICSAWAVAAQVQEHRTKIRNITDSSDPIIGGAIYADNTGNVSNISHLHGSINITAVKTFELQHRCTNTRATTGFGVPVGFGTSEVYAEVHLIKVV